MDTGHLIAIHLLLLYLILGPLVLLIFYVLFDALSKSGGESDGTQQDTAARPKDPALWTSEDINTHMSRF